MEQKRHPFSYTLGPGPYKWVGSFDLGAAISALNSGNVNGHNNAMANAPRLESGMGTCSHCGQAILLIQVVQTGEGKRFGVGSDCILKVGGEGDFSDISKMEREIKMRKRKQGRDRRDRKRDELKKVCEQLVQSNESKLSKLPHPSPNNWFADKNLKDYAIWFLEVPRSLGAYEMFRNKIENKLNEVA